MPNPWIEAFIRLIYPAGCGLCPELLRLEENRVCAPCLEAFAKEALDASDRRISHSLEYLDGAWAVFRYSAHVRRLMNEIKFRGRCSLLGVFKPYLLKALVLIEKKVFDVVVPVPGSLKTRLQRKFNPPDLIAEEIALALEIPALQPLLWKKSGIEAQSLLSKEERLANLYGAFKIRPFKRVGGSRILLVDDVFTTGSTADEAARILKKHGAASVDLFTLARTVLQ